MSRTQATLNDAVQAIRATGPEAIACAADVTCRSEVEGAVEAIRSELGSVDVLVNNAGSGRAIGPVWETDPEVWWRDVEVNLRGTLLCCHAVLPSMIARRRGAS